MRDESGPVDPLPLLVRWFDEQLGRGVAREEVRHGLLRAVVGLFERDLGVRLVHALPAAKSVEIAEVAGLDWSRVRAEVLGALYEHSLRAGERHAGGVHFTDPGVLAKIVEPTIVAPWLAQISVRSSPELHARLLRYRVLDPACGAGNFLVAVYRALVGVERRLRECVDVGDAPRVGPGQCFGVDRDPLAVEVARVALQVADRRACDLSGNFLVMDALVTDSGEIPAWPFADAIVGNPPFLDARKLTGEYGRAYAERLRGAYPGVPGRADLCVYWFRRAHDVLPVCSPDDPVAGRAGLVGTKTVRENYSREGGLDHIVASGGVIVDAVASQAWPGAAAVDVAIVNWVKGWHVGPCVLQDMSNERREVAEISSSLGAGVDVAGARVLEVVTATKKCFEGQQPGHVGFRLDAGQRAELAARDPRLAEVVFPYMNGASLLTGGYLREPGYIIDLGERTLEEAAAHPDVLAHVERTVLPDWRANARRERLGRGTGEHQRREKVWWLLKRRRSELLAAIAGLPRYVVCVRHTQRPIFEFLAASIRPDSALTVFAFADDYSFGVLQSNVHWQWFMARCSSIGRRHRYTSETVFDAFPWPQRAGMDDMRIVAERARALRALRRELVGEGGLRALYRENDEDPGHPLRAAQTSLDAAVMDAYGFTDEREILGQLLRLNRAVGAGAVGPGGPGALVSGDCVAAW